MKQTATIKKTKSTEKTIIDTYFPSNEVFESWKNDYIDFKKEDDENYEIENDSELIERYYENIEMQIEDEKINLNKYVDGVIIAFANLGFWNGRRNGAKMFNDNINSIIWSENSCEYFKLYADRYNVKGKMSHHDGTHYLTYRVAPSYEDAERILDKAHRGELTEDYFKRKTKSLRKHIAKIYGW